VDILETINLDMRRYSDSTQPHPTPSMNAGNESDAPRLRVAAG
jgi:hypothetical protein